MNTIKLVGTFIKIILTLAFLGFVLRSIVLLLKHEIGTKTYVEKMDSSIDYPTIYFCPMGYNSKSVTNVLLDSDYNNVENLPRIQDQVVITWNYVTLFDESGLNSEIITLNNVSHLWNEFVWVYGHVPPFMAFRCAEIGIPNYEKHQDKLSMVEMRVKNHHFGLVMIDFRQHGESTLNYKPNWSLINIISIPNEPLIHYVLETKLFKRLDNCELEKQQQFHCIQQFMASQLDCVQPWLEKFTLNGTKSCPMDVKKYLHLQLEIFQYKKDEELKEFGCLKPKCHEMSWQARKLMTITEKSLVNNPEYESIMSPNESVIYFSLFSNDVRRCIFLVFLDQFMSCFFFRWM